LRAAVVAISLASLPAISAAAQPIDYYVLALSWSPTYCDARDARRDMLQCGPDADFRFIVYGLWPNTATQAPGNCRTGAPPPSRRTVRQMLDIMPGERLIRHQWRKHGACSGMAVGRYFGAVRAAAGRTVIPAGLATLNDTIRVRPDILRKAFRQANPDLPEDGI